MEEMSLEEANKILKEGLAIGNFITTDWVKTEMAVRRILNELDNRIPREDIEDKKKECENRKFSDFTYEPNFAVEKVLNELLNKE